MALKILGIDLGSHAVKVAELKSSFRSMELISLEEVQLGRSGPGAPALAEQLAAVAKLNPAASGRPDVVVLGLPGASAAVHRMTFPFADTKRLEQTLAFEVEGQIPFDLADVLFDYELLTQQTARRDRPARSEVLVGVARKTQVAELCDAFRPLGLDPRILTLPGLALAQLLPAQSAPPPSGEAVVDLGHTRVGVLIREDGRPSFVRAFEGGGAALTAALARARGLDWASAEALKHQLSLRGGDADLQQVLVRALQPVLRELRQTLKQSAGRKPVERLLLTGGTAALDGIDELFNRELGLPTEHLPAPEVPGHSIRPRDFPTRSLALGLALRGHAGNRGSRFNLRRGDQSFQGDMTKLRGRLVRAGALASLLLVLFGVRGYAELSLLGKREKQIDDAICERTKQTAGKCVRDPTVAKSLLAAAGGTAATIPEQSAVQLLTEASNRMAIEGSKVTELDVGVDQVQLRGQADSYETVEKIATALKGYHCFTDVQRGRMQRMHDSTEVEFALSVRNDCAGGGTP